jgi:8-oxo-dGTP diphosphatase
MTTNRPLRDWLVGGAVIETEDGLLLVQNRRRDGTHDWTTPGGVIETTEELLAGLAREVFEETGLTVTGWAQQLYEVVTEAPDMGWRMRVESWRASGVSGELVVDDPDGIVQVARYVPHADCAGLFATTQRWVREPMGDWIAERWTGVRTYRYRLDGADRATAVVSRHEP